jgi:hypothetical protein
LLVYDAKIVDTVVVPYTVDVVDLIVWPFPVVDCVSNTMR